MTAEFDPQAGYAPRQLADIQRETNARLAEIVDPASGEKPFQNASDDTILQQVVAIVSEQVARVENIAKVSFDQRDPLAAVGVALAALVQLNAIIKKPGASSIIPVTLEADPSTVIERGFLVSNPNGDVSFALDETVVVPQSGTIDATATCTTFGPVDPEPGTIVVIQTPVSGWRSVTNGKTLSPGSNEETDAELRRRQQQSTNATSYRQIEAIRAAILNVPGVTFCRTYQNMTLATDGRGIPGKTLACVVAGGDSRDVAEAILYRPPLGIGYHGNVAETFYDEQAMAEVVRYSRPIERPVSVRVTLAIVVDENIQVFPSNGVALIKAAILDFAASGHTRCEPLGNTGFPPGQDIIRSYLYTPINSIGGARIDRLELGIDGEPLAEQDVTIAWDEIGVFAADRIEVVFT